jgi:hypothetical protein
MSKKLTADADEASETSSEAAGTVIFSYSELIGDDTKAALQASITNAVNTYMEGAEEEMAEASQYFVYIFYVCSIFVGLWLIQFLFAFLHMFARNKRFHMWYTKLLCWIPPMIWLATFIMSKESFIEKIFASVGGGVDVPANVIAGVASGITSFTWISGACLLALWIVSIFWAFPIKHKIRKLKKEIKREIRANKRELRNAA